MGILTPLQLVIYMIHLLILYMVDHNLPVDIVVTGGQKNWSFASNSGIPQLIWSKFGVGAQVKGRQRSGNLGGGGNRPSGGKIGGSDNSHAAGCFWFAKPDDFENFPLRGLFAPKNLKIEGVKQVPDSLSATAHTAERYSSLHIVVQGPGSFLGLSVFMTCLLIPYKTCKKYLPMTALQSRMTEHAKFSYLRDCRNISRLSCFM